MTLKSDSFLSNINKKAPDGIGPNGKNRRILIVDDSTVMRKIISQILRSEMYDVCGEASNGQEAIEMYQELKPDVVTLDVNMPIKDGLTTLKEILAIDPKALVVMLTSEGEQKMVLEAIQAGAKYYVVKPPDREVLLEKVKSSMVQG